MHALLEYSLAGDRHWGGHGSMGRHATVSLTCLLHGWVSRALASAWRDQGEHLAIRCAYSFALPLLCRISSVVTAESWRVVNIDLEVRRYHGRGCPYHDHVQVLVPLQGGDEGSVSKPAMSFTRFHPEYALDLTRDDGKGRSFIHRLGNDRRRGVESSLSIGGHCQDEIDSFERDRFLGDGRKSRLDLL